METRLRALYQRLILWAHAAQKIERVCVASGDEHSFFVAESGELLLVAFVVTMVPVVVVAAMSVTAAMVLVVASVLAMVRCSQCSARPDICTEDGSESFHRWPIREP